MDKYKHISFRTNWKISPDCAYMLGQCNALVQALSEIPLKPEYRSRMLRISLIKGARATTAIEGNTLSEEEIEKLQEGWRLPPSKEYLEIEVKNILEALNTLLGEVTHKHYIRVLTSDLIREFHRMIGKDLGKHLDAVPGKFRSDSRVVGPYVTPNYKYVPDLTKKLCEWLNSKAFLYDENQKFALSIIQAIVAHVYVEWIHPFGDGNGRTGRLLEFYILLRAGLPNITSHILSNFYNETRPEYYRQLDNARKVENLTEFINYAVRGFRDGLTENLKVIQESQFTIFWHNYVYEIFADVKYTKKEAFKRKRKLMLEMLRDREYTVDELMILTPKITKAYAKLKRTTILRDLNELQELELIIKVGKKYKANSGILKAMMPTRKS